MEGTSEGGMERGKDGGPLDRPRWLLDKDGYCLGAAGKGEEKGSPCHLPNDSATHMVPLRVPTPSDLQLLQIEDHFLK